MTQARVTHTKPKIATTNKLANELVIQTTPLVLVAAYCTLAL